MVFKPSLGGWKKECFESMLSGTSVWQQVRTWKKGQEPNKVLSLICQWSEDWWSLSPALSVQALRRPSVHLVDTQRDCLQRGGEKPWQLGVCVCVRGGGCECLCDEERRRIGLHFYLPRRSKSTICWKHLGLINKSLVNIHSFQGCQSTISINHTTQQGTPSLVRSE